jgi:anti-sigma factor (TIGR02949 family)
MRLKEESLTQGFTRMSMKTFKTIDCAEALKIIFDYIDNYLKDKSRIEFERHLDACRHCFDRVEFEKLLKSKLRMLQPKTASNQLRKRVDDLLNHF